MKFALVNGEKTEAQTGLQGTCSYCQSATVAKCGQVRIWHWAHKSKMSCDPWWENETEWHRAWKDHFPKEWQENIHIDPATGEKHIADVKTASGLVVEFQHSAIRPEEAQSREKFYTNMVWVVNGTRLKSDYPRFCKGFNALRPLKVSGIFISMVPNKCFPASWLNSSVPIYLDFQVTDQQDKLRSVLWCLFPGRIEGHAVVAGVPREDFVKFASDSPHFLFARELLGNISKLLQEQRAASEKKHYVAADPLLYARRPTRRRFRL